MSDVDVLIAGAGAGGLFAALAAADAGRSVLVLERDRRFSDNANTGRSTGLVTAGGTAQQRAAGVTDSPATYEADLLRKNRGASCPAVVRAVAESAPTVVDTAVERWGAPLHLIPDLAFPGHSVNRAHGPGSRKGRHLMSALVATARANGNIDLHTGVGVGGLLVDGRGGVIGVRSSAGGGAQDELSADRVILAVNGFGANREWVSRYIPEIAGATYFGGPHSDGAGIAWGVEAGAALANMSAYQGHCTIAPDAGTLMPFVLLAGGGILVNRDGRRFGDESVGYSEFAVDVVRQPGDRVWEVFDQHAYDLAVPYDDFQESLETGIVHRYESLGALAAAQHLPVAALTEELEAVALCADGSAVDRFGRRFARGLEPPLYCSPVTGALFHTQGGLRVDARARVLDTGGRPIRNLYAVGGTAAGISGDGAAGYMAGNGLTAAAALGFIAGSDA